MDKEPAKRIKTHRCLARRRDQERSGSTTQQSTASAMDGRMRSTKREASPVKNTQSKKTKVSRMTEPCSNSEEDSSVRGKKRKDRDNGDAPSKKTKKQKGGLLNQYNRESTSSSVETDRESSSNPLEGCSTALEHVNKRSSKRKAAADADGQTRKTKRSLDLKESKNNTQEETKKETKEESLFRARRAQFEAKYTEQNQLGEGGCGSVFAGYRNADNLPVAIKHIPNDKVLCKEVDHNGRQLSVEVAVMLKLAAKNNGSVGTSAPVSLLDWYDLGKELILVQERPVPCEDLLQYIEDNGGSLQEDEAKIILKQLVYAATELQEMKIFHRDIKVENILIETDSEVPRVRLIDFGLSCFFKKRSLYRVFYGTPAHIPPEFYSRKTYWAGPTTVWQVGVVLFEMLHRNTQFETPRFLRDELKISNTLSEDCQDFLQMCLTKVPEERATLEQLLLHPWLR
ncbi:serine/threonine-protein kinase pim-2 [Lates calcarifer]|uniref:non-specific serine/threonine protein kinase n=1 Tax=Lates calcarifer TaxID=8187 RepID=A0A4W6FZ95_LATCA|nr:serine/threonine-protein kinase pim-2 [Lates calcarifer]